MRQTLITSLGLLALLTGCAAAPSKAITAIDQPDFINLGSGNRLHLGLHGDYTLTYPEIRAPDHNRPQRVTGHWDLLSAGQQTVILDGRTPVRVSYHPGGKTQWQFTPVTLVARSTIVPGTENNYQETQGQWLVRKVAVTPAADEQSISGMLAPEARGTR